MTHSLRAAFRQWIASGDGGKKFRFADETKANYLTGKNHPFPLNPYFIPKAPLTEDRKEEIFATWKANPGKRVTDICSSYGISLRRLEAIIRLKQYEKTFDAKVSACFCIFNIST